MNSHIIDYTTIIQLIFYPGSTIELTNKKNYWTYAKEHWTKTIKRTQLRNYIYDLLT